jgi:hypothetical protein
MDNRRKIYRIIERHVNKKRKESLESFYGINTKIKVNHINFGITSKSVIIDCIVNLGDEISEEILIPDMVDALVKEIVFIIYSDLKIYVQVSWDI